MKVLKLTITACALFFMSCGSDDITIPVEIERIIQQFIPEITANVDAIIALAADSDITDLVNFGQPTGVSSSDYLVEFKLSDSLVLKQPIGIQVSDTLWYDYFDWYDALNNPIDDNTAYSFIEPFIPYDAVTADHPDFPPGSVELSTEFQFKNVAADPVNDLNWKYDIICYISRDGVYYGPFTIDPKIRVKAGSAQ